MILHCLHTFDFLHKDFLDSFYERFGEKGHKTVDIFAHAELEDLISFSEDLKMTPVEKKRFLDAVQAVQKDWGFEVEAVQNGAHNELHEICAAKGDVVEAKGNRAAQKNLPDTKGKLDSDADGKSKPSHLMENDPVDANAEIAPLTDDALATATPTTACTWFIESRKFDSKDTRQSTVMKFPTDASPTLTDFVATISPTVTSHKKGGCNFKAAAGRGTLEVKCNRVLRDSLKVHLRVGGDIVPPFTMIHDFKDKPIARIPHEFDFQSYLRRKASTDNFKIAVDMSPNFKIAVEMSPTEG